MVAMTADSDQLPAILLTETTATVTGGDRHTRPGALSNSSPQTSDPHHQRRYDIGFISTGEFTHPRVYPVVCLGNDTALPEKSHAHGIAFSGVSPASTATRNDNSIQGCSVERSVMQSRTRGA
jgi:hypothetical protein